MQGYFGIVTFPQGRSVPVAIGKVLEQCRYAGSSRARWRAAPVLMVVSRWATHATTSPHKKLANPRGSDGDAT